MALGFTSHYANHEQAPFGTLALSNNDCETSGSVAYADNTAAGLIYNSVYDSCEFSSSVEIDYSQYANFIASSGSSETAGSIAYGECSFSTASTVSTCGSFSGGCVSSGGGFANTFTC